MHNSAKNILRKQQACWVISDYISDEIATHRNTKINDFDWPECFGEYKDFSQTNARYATFGFVWQRRAIIC